jgi:hypothetical protein
VGTLTGEEAFLYPPTSPRPAITKAQAETLARQQGFNPGVSVKGATLASFTPPAGIDVRGPHEVRRLEEALIVTIGFGHRVRELCTEYPAKPFGTSATTTTAVPSTGCGMWVSKYIVAVDALTGSVQYLMQTN